MLYACTSSVLYHINKFRSVLLCTHHAIKCHLFDPRYSILTLILFLSIDTWMASSPAAHPRTREDHDPASGSDCPSLGTSGRSIKFKWQVPTRRSSQYTGMTWEDVANNSILPISRKCAITPKPLNFIPIRCHTMSLQRLDGLHGMRGQVWFSPSQW